ncbi:MAG: extracellular solute-binding protein [Actinomycetes bacterium]
MTRTEAAVGDEDRTARSGRTSSRGRTASRPARRRALVAALAIAGMGLAACGGGSGGGPSTLTWYTNPDNGGQARLAEKCTKEAGGRYSIVTQGLPTAADQQREQLVRRLAAKDSSIDLMSLDPPFTAEFANAGYLYEFSEAERAEFTEGVLDAPIEAAEFKGKLVAAPFWANTQLLWYRKSVAEAAGVDPTAEDFTWEQMIEAADAQEKTIGVQALRYEGYMVWINALVDSAGGQILEDSAAGADAVPSLESASGEAAAEVIGDLARSKAAVAGIATADEEAARVAFQSDSGGFMVNWPYIWQAANAEVDAGGLDKAVVDDIGWARYPRVDAGTPSAPPLGGINLAIGAYSDDQRAAVDAARCITSTENKTVYMLDSGNPSAASASYDDPEVVEAFPMASLIRESIDDAGPRPITPFYTDVTTSVQRTWHPPGSVNPDSTPAEADSLITQVLDGEVLL